MPDNVPPLGVVDAFILFNEREEVVVPLVEQLESAGIRTYFFRRDIDPGADLQRIELENLLAAKVVLVFLGPLGWGPTHERLVDEAMRLAKVLIPVLVGQPPEDALVRGRGIFQRLRYIEIKSIKESDEAIYQLANQIRQTPVPEDRQFDALVASFVDGAEEDRLRSLQRVRSLSVQQRIRLAVRLRMELTDRFGREQTSGLDSSPRAQPQIPGIRSWLFSALIWSDVESDATRELIKTELHTAGDGGFWILSQLYLVRASYLIETAKLVTDLSGLSEDARLLAQVLLVPLEEMIPNLSNRLDSDDFHTVWPALRVMRVVSFPGLVESVCRLFLTSKADSQVAYDALYALCGSANEAAKILAAEPGVEATVRRIVEIARLPNESAKMNFAVVLAAFIPTDVDRCLDAIESDPLNAPIARSLRAYLRTHRRQARVGLGSMPGFKSDDINAKNDFLGFDRDVQTLTSVMISKAVTPPLAIGLFGDWGNGKSHFMQSMENAVNVLCERAVASNSKDFCRNVVQIRFNAWHYADTALWASLVSHILEQLAAYVNPSKRPDEQRQDLLKELESAKDLRSRVEADKAQVDEDVRKRAAELQELHKQREQKEFRLRDLKINDLRTLLEKDPAAKQALDDALMEMGVPSLIHSSQDLSAALKEANAAGTRAAMLFNTVFKAKRGLTFYVLLIVASIGIPAAAWTIHHYFNVEDVYTHVAAWVGAIMAFLGACASVIRNAVSILETKLEAVQKAKTTVDELLIAKRAETTVEEAQLQSEIASLGEKEKLAVARLTAASARVTEIEERINNLDREFSLTRFLVDRMQADDYRKHLGLVSLVRRDFTNLRDRLFRTRGVGEKEVDRVVLYIDDLDRCTPETVMSVLQAVHLLLAFDLFVVVVGVDPRWLMHALREEYTMFAKDGRAPSTPGKNWQATPQDYLEKIFQIPYCLPRMNAEGFARMVDYELAPTAEMRAANASDDQTIIVSSVTPSPPGGHANPSTVPTVLRSPTLATPQPSIPNIPSPSPPPAKSFEVVPEALVLREWETKFAARLESLVHTPRAVKRFANIYRILKASVEPAHLLKFEGVAAAPGDFQVPMTLLAMLIGSPIDCVKLFPRLVQIAAAEQDPCLFLTQDDGSEESVSMSMRDRLRPIVGEQTFPGSCDVFAHWLPLVARFSFDVDKALHG